MTTYKLLPSQPAYGESQVVLRVNDGASIPKNPDNTDYQDYLAWLAEGNIPNSPDENVNEG
jgi:hypothetical protein